MHTFDGRSLAELALGKRNIIMQFSAKIGLPLKREGSRNLIQSPKEYPFVKLKLFYCFKLIPIKNGDFD